jgi:hypothetical protein
MSGELKEALEQAKMAEEDALCSKKVAEMAEEKRNLMRSRLYNYRGSSRPGHRTAAGAS